MGKVGEVLGFLMGEAPRIAGAIYGTPGSGKTTFLELFKKYAKKHGIRVLPIGMKDCLEKEPIKVKIPDLEKKVARKISSILHFTASSSLKPSFDLLITSKCETIDCLVDFAEKKFRNDIAPWITSKLIILKEYFIDGDELIIYPCLEEFDELIRRMSIGLVYALRSQILCILVIDDAISLVLNRMYGDVWPAVTRPYVVSYNFYPNADETLRYDPVIIAPGGRSYYKLAKPDKYIVMYRGKEWEIDAHEVIHLAKSL
jgi:hypothetical protein